VHRYQYLLLMAACLLVTLPLEVVFGARVWRQPLRLALAILPVAAAFSLWDVAAIAHHQWAFARRYVTGWQLPGRLPIEEVVFFLVIPICAVLTFEVVSRAARAMAR
jgi:lycopene cyclase domain-containing protein